MRKDGLHKGGTTEFLLWRKCSVSWIWCLLDDCALFKSHRTKHYTEWILLYVIRRNQLGCKGTQNGMQTKIDEPNCIANE